MLEVREIRKRMGRVLAVDDCSFTIESSQRVALKGENGAGKTTLLRILAGLLVPDAGWIDFNSVALTSGPSKARKRARRQISYVPEAADPPGHLSVRELLDFMAKIKKSEPCSSELIEKLRITPLLSQKISDLSLGQRRRACLAAALIGDPTFLLLDEPTNGLDARSLEDLAQMLQVFPGAILLATHDRDFAKAVCKRELVMAAGQIASEPR